MPRAIDAVGSGPIPDRLFPVSPQQPHAVAFTLFSAKLVGQFQQDGGGRAAVVGSDISCVAQGIIGVVVTGDNDHTLSSSRKLCNQVAYRKFPIRGIGNESVFFDTVPLQVIEDVVFQFLVIGAPDGTRAERHNLARVLHGPGSIERFRLSLLDPWQAEKYGDGPHQQPRGDSRPRLSNRAWLG